MRRRMVLIGATAVLAGVAGCSTNGGTAPDASGSQKETATDNLTETPTPFDVTLPDCDTAERPGGENSSIQPAAYPDKPASLQDDAAVLDYVEAYEKAYGKNRLIDGMGSDLLSYSIVVSDARAYEGSNGSRIVRLKMTIHYTVKEGDKVLAGDGWNIPIVYFVNETMVVRAQVNSSDADDMNLDLRALEDGTVLECTG